MIGVYQNDLTWGSKGYQDAYGKELNSDLTTPNYLSSSDLFLKSQHI